MPYIILAWNKNNIKILSQMFEKVFMFAFFFFSD